LFPHACKVFDLFAEHETVQANRVLEAIKVIPGARIIGQDIAEMGARASTISMTVGGVSSIDAVKSLVKKEIALRNGHFYARRCVEALGIDDADDGIIRISLVHYNSEYEVERLVAGIKDL